MRAKIIYYIKEYSLPVIGTFFVIWLLTSVIFQWGIVPSASMSPTADGGSIIIANRLSYLRDYPEHGDIVVFTNHEEDDMIVFKRVIGLEGDTIEFKDGLAYRNGIKLQEDYLHDPESSMSLTSSFYVPKNTVFVLGDNRKHSNDSRNWVNSYVEYKDIISKVFLVIPFGNDCETDSISFL